MLLPSQIHYACSFYTHEGCIYSFLILWGFSHYVASRFGGRRFKDKKENVEPEADPERDQRTVFAYQVGGF